MNLHEQMVLGELLHVFVCYGNFFSICLRFCGTNLLMAFHVGYGFCISQVIIINTTYHDMLFQKTLKM